MLRNIPPLALLSVSICLGCIYKGIVSICRDAHPLAGLNLSEWIGHQTIPITLKSPYS